MKIEDVMTRRVVACRADSDLAHVARLMWENDCGVVPVVDAEDRVIGMLSDRDALMSAFFQGQSLRDLRAGACMAREVVGCRPGDSLDDAARLMATKRVRRLPVTDEEGRLLGMLSLGDLAAFSPVVERKKDRTLLGEAARKALEGVCARPLPSEPAALEPEELAPAPRRARPGKSGAGKPARARRGARRS